MTGYALNVRTWTGPWYEKREEMKPMAAKPKNQDNQVETTRPMAVREITVEDKLEAMEARITALEKQVDRHEKYHFGKRGL